MDANEFNKIMGAVIGSLLIFLLLGFFSGQVFHSSDGHHGEEETLAFALDTGEDEGDAEDGAAEEPALDLVQLASAADPAAGEKVFNKCKACHKVEDGANAVGPHLHNLVGRQIASVGGYAYSDALGSHDGVWGVDNLMAWLGNPDEFAPGNKMGYALGDAGDRMNVIAWLNGLGDSPVDLVADAEASAPPAAEEEVEVAAADPAPAEEPATDVATEETATEAETVPAPEAETGDAAAESTEQPADAADVTEEAAATDVAAEDATTEEAATETAAAEDEVEVAVAEPAAAAEAPAAEAAAPAAAASPYAALLASATAEAGEKVYRKCRSCHQVQPGRHQIGPSLYGVVGREIASADGYNYSDALMAKDGVWDLDNLMAWLEAPGDYAPGTKMNYRLRDEEERVNVIVYLNGLSDAPITLEAAATVAEAEPQTAAAEEAASEEAAAAPEPEAVEEPAEVTETAEAKEAPVAEAPAAEETAAAEETTEAAPAETAATEEATTEAEIEVAAVTPAETAEAPAPAAAAAPASAYAALLADASVEAGEKAFRRCVACHKVEEGKNGVGPSLWGVVGRPIASADGYSYSDALRGVDGVWDLDNLMAWLEAPATFAPGTKMNYRVRRDTDRINVIVYLNAQSDAPVDFAAAPAVGEAETEVAALEEAASEATEEAATETATEATTEASTEEVTETVAAPEPAEASAEEAPAAEATEAAAAASDADAAPEPEATEEASEAAASEDEVEVAAVEPAETAEVPAAAAASPYAALLADASAEAGEKAFRRCVACHKVEEGNNGVGPSLYGVVGRPIASADGYGYSDALKGVDGVWGLDNLMAWLEAPATFAPGTKMNYRLRRESDRINVIVYLNEAGGKPVALGE